MTDQVGDIVAIKREGRVGRVVQLKGKNKVRVRFADTIHGPNVYQEMTFKKKDLRPVLERNAVPGHVAKLERGK